MSHVAADRYAWAEPEVEDLGGGVYRIPLPLPLDGLGRSTSTRSPTPAGRPHRRGHGPGPVPGAAHRGAAAVGYELGDIRNFFVTHIHIDHYSLAVELRQNFRSVISLGEGERANLIAHQGTDQRQPHP